MENKVNRLKSSDFIAGYIYKSIERNTLRNTDAFKSIPDEGYADVVSFPKVWVGGQYNEDCFRTPFQHKMSDVLKVIEDAFNSCFGRHHQIILAWGQDDAPSYVCLQFRVVKIQPKKMTVSDIEKALGYKVEIVSDVK